MTESIKSGRKIEEQIIARLRQRGFWVTTAESCTGGLLAAALVDVPGCSEVLGEGYITYSNDAKRKLLGVEKEALERFGAVSSQVAEQMAQGAARAAGAQVAVAVTGIAGPGGGTAEKPVGLVYIGTFVEGSIQVTEHHFKGSRREIRMQTVSAALQQLYQALA